MTDPTQITTAWMIKKERNLYVNGMTDCCDYENIGCFVQSGDFTRLPHKAVPMTCLFGNHVAWWFPQIIQYFDDSTTLCLLKLWWCARSTVTLTTHKKRTGSQIFSPAHLESNLNYEINVYLTVSFTTDIVRLYLPSSKTIHPWFDTAPVSFAH